jgi:transcription antitermination factor NusG
MNNSASELNLDKRNWRALYVYSRHEKKVFSRLNEIGIDAYLPLVRTLKQWSDRKKWVEEPLIKGYVFVNVSEKERGMVFVVEGVVNYLRFQGKDALVRDEEIYALKKLIEYGYNFEATDSQLNFRKGDYVLINHGPLKGIKGIVTKSPKNAKIELELTSLKKLIRVEVPLECVTQADIVNVKA